MKETVKASIEVEGLEEIKRKIEILCKKTEEAKALADEIASTELSVILSTQSQE